MAGKTLWWILKFLVPVLTSSNDAPPALGTSNHFDWNVESYVDPVKQSIEIRNSTNRGIEIPDENTEEVGSKLLFNSPELDEYANSSADDTTRILSNPAQYVILQFSSTVVVKNLDDNREYTVSELHSVDEEMSKLTVKDPQHNATSTCSFHTGGFGQATTGIRCRTSRNFPEECFCWDKVCKHPYLPLHKVFLKFTSQGGDFKQIFPGLFTWNVEKQDLKLNATFKVVRNKFLYPLDISIEGFGYAIGSKQDTARLKYSVILFQPEDPDPISAGHVFNLQPPDGIFCPRSTIHPPQTFPDFPNQFSVQIETIQKDSRKVSYSQHHYDLKHKLVSMKFSPRPHSSPSIFLSTLSLAPHLLPQTYNIIHDFNTGLQYTVSDRTGNCSVQPISPTYSDAAKLDGRTVRLKLAYELLDVSPQKFVFSGKKYIRGILADVWTAEKPGENADDPYSTIELFFSDYDYTVQIGEVNDLKNVPLGMITYHASSRTAAYFHTTIINHYFEFSSASPHWKVYDISSCMAFQDRLFLKLNLQVSYSQLIQFSLTAAQDSIQSALASEAHVSPLRVVDIFLSSSSQSSGVDVWFVLLQKPKVDGKDVTINAGKEPDLDNAYDKLLATFESDYQISLHFGDQKRMLVTVQEGSLEHVNEAVHPASRGRSYLFLRATYTAGSMAGLGFSMAVLGLSIGIFVGFLLWKGRLGLPYYYGCHRTPILRSPMADLTDINEPYGGQDMTPAYPGPPPPLQELGVRY